MMIANPGLALRAITSSKGADYRPFAIEAAFGEIELKRLEKQMKNLPETQALTHGDSNFGSADEDSERKAWQKPLPFGNDFSWVYSKSQGVQLAQIVEGINNKIERDQLCEDFYLYANSRSAIASPYYKLE